MIPKGISEKDFIYNNVTPLQMKEFNDEFDELLESFMQTLDESLGDLEINRTSVGRICMRIDQRKDYFMYFHSTESLVMHMSHEKEMALCSFWVKKYKPIRFAKMSDDEYYFNAYGCTVSDAFAAHIIISIVCANNESMAEYFTKDVVADLYYDLANRDFSKEAIMSKIDDLIGVSTDDNIDKKSS